MSGRKKYDDDADRLPPGMKRVGYDAETQRYTFREGDDLWLGEPGSLQGGRMKWAGRAPDAAQPIDEGEEEYTVEGRDPVPPYERTPKAPSKSDAGEWGVPVHSISDSHTKLSESTGPGASLKRRASRFKEVASSTVVANGVVRKLTGKRRPPRPPPKYHNTDGGRGNGNVTNLDDAGINM